MDAGELIEGCKAEAVQIGNYDPDPYYVGYFFRSYLGLVARAYGCIFEEAARDFGLPVDRGGMGGFREKSVLKNDPGAVEFVSWYGERFEREHRGGYPGAMRAIAGAYGRHKRLPPIRIMIRARERCRDDVPHPVRVGLRGGKLRSRGELAVEVNRQIPAFLKAINRKRRENGEPAVAGDCVVASAFFECHGGFEIAYAARVYVRTVERMVSDSRRKITELASRG